QPAPRSISKSIVGLLYGIALAEGRVPALDQPLVDQFPAYADLARDPQRRRLTIAHALSMTLGTEWDETLPYTSARNSEMGMGLAGGHAALRARSPDRRRAWQPLDRQRRLQRAARPSDRAGHGYAA